MTNTPPPFDPNTNPKAAAKAAQAYAKASRPWFKKKRFIIPIALVALGVISGGLGGGDTDPADDTATVSETNSETKTSEKKPAEKKKAPEKKKVKVVKVDAKTLIQEFEKNELAGDKKYKGKTLQVSGVVDKIDTELFDGDKYILRIGTGADWDFLTVNCNDMDTDELSTLNADDDVIAIGKFEDGGDLGVELKDCKLK